MKKLFSKLILILSVIFIANVTVSIAENDDVEVVNVYSASVQDGNMSEVLKKSEHSNVWSNAKKSAKNLFNKKSSKDIVNNTNTNDNEYKNESVKNIIPEIKKTKKTKQTNVAKQINKIKSVKKSVNVENKSKQQEISNNSNVTKKTFIPDISNLKQKLGTKKAKQTATSNELPSVQNIVPKENNKKHSLANTINKQKNNVKSVFLRKSKKDTGKKLKFEKHSLTDINESRNIKHIKRDINNEEYFKHDVKNKIYLDRFNTFGAESEKSTFYEKKDIFEDENGDIQLRLQGKTVDKLMDEIEQSNPQEENAHPVDLTLRDSIAIAIAKHPDILSAKLNTEIYKAQILQAWSAYFPTFSAGINWGYDYTRYHGFRNGYGYNSMYLPNMSADMLLFDFGKTKSTVDIAKTDYDASRYDLQDSISNIVYSIKSAYYNVLFAEKQVEVYNKTIEDFDLQLKSAQKYFSIGKKPQIDVLTAEYNAGNAKLNLVKANNTLENAKVLFANTLGLPEFANFNLCDNLPYSEYEIDLEELLKDAFNIRPDLLSYEKSVEANYLAVRRAKRYFTPDLNASGGLSYSDIDDSNTSNYRVSVGLSYSSFNFLQLKKAYDLALKSYKKSLVDYDSKRQSVYLEVKQAFIDFNNAKQGVKQAEMNVEQAKAQHYHATGRYKAGFGDAIEIKDAENTYLNAQLAYYQALLDYNLSLAELERVVGRPIEGSNVSNGLTTSDNNEVEKAEEEL